MGLSGITQLWLVETSIGVLLSPQLFYLKNTREIKKALRTKIRRIRVYMEPNFKTCVSESSKSIDWELILKHKYKFFSAKIGEIWFWILFHFKNLDKISKCKDRISRLVHFWMQRRRSVQSRHLRAYPPYLPVLLKIQGGGLYWFYYYGIKVN